MTPLRFLNAEGIFGQDSLDFTDQQGEVQALSSLLEPFIGAHVKLSAHFFPKPPDPLARGGGACLWPDGQCPFGHDADRLRMFRFDGEGQLGRKRDGSWRLTSLDGLTINPQLEVLMGHRGRVVCLAVEDIARSMQRPADPADLAGRLASLTNILNGLKT
jgi:hypothetical protein